MDILALLADKHPEFFLMVQYGNIPQKKMAVEPFSDSLPNLEGIQSVYCFGIGNGDVYRKLESWLHERSDRCLVIIEDDLAKLNAVVHAPIAPSLFSDPQVMFCLLFDSDWRARLRAAIWELPYTRVAVIATPAYRKKRPQKFSALREYILRQTAALEALLSEGLQYDKLVDNLVENFRRLPTAFDAHLLEGKFTGVPAIICGAGPSLQKAAPLLSPLKSRVLLFAGGSAIAALHRLGIEPHFGLALDPNPEEKIRLEKVKRFSAPFLYANRVCPSVFQICRGPHGIMRCNTGGAFETWMEEKCQLTGKPIGDDLSQEAFSVTTIAMAMAVHMGCNPIIFCGVDLAYTGDQRYAPGVTVRKEEKPHGALDAPLIRRGIGGKKVGTLVRWVMESSAIGDYAKKHRDRKFINCTEGGLGLKGVPNLSLAKAAKKHLISRRNLSQRVDKAIAAAKITTIQPKALRLAIRDLRESMQYCMALIREYREEIASLKQKEGAVLETGKMVFLEEELKEEAGFRCFLATLLPMLDRIRRTLGEESRIETLERADAKWKKAAEVMEKIYKRLAYF